MSYREENGQVILEMSREDYENLLSRLGVSSRPFRWSHEEHWKFLDRLNEGNPSYTPYRVAPAEKD